MSTLRRQVGAMVKYHREKAGLTQGELGEKTGNALETISRIERGKSAPSFATIERIAEALSIDARDLFGVGSHSAKGGRSDPMVRIVELLAGHQSEDLEWIERLISVALEKKKSA